MPSIKMFHQGLVVTDSTQKGSHVICTLQTNISEKHYPGKILQKVHQLARQGDLSQLTFHIKSGLILSREKFETWRRKYKNAHTKTDTHPHIKKNCCNSELPPHMHTCPYTPVKHGAEPQTARPAWCSHNQPHGTAVQSGDGMKG